MSYRRDVMNELAQAFILTAAKVMDISEFNTVITAIRLIDALIADIHVRGQEGERDVIDVDRAMLDSLAEWRTEEEELSPDPDFEAAINAHGQFEMNFVWVKRRR